MKQEGPRNIGLGSIRHYRFPITAISSILHRLSGVLLFILIPFLIWALDCSLRSPASFENVKEGLTSGFCGFILWLMLSAITYHIFAGVRHLFMDVGKGESMCAAKATSMLVIALGVIAAICWGVWIW
tara:strand:+ start:131 stop:514 length:384 start_codon:yes stop_codon:yes gene_type:complete